MLHLRDGLLLIGGFLKPYWKIWVRQWEGWHPIYEMENKKCLKPPDWVNSQSSILLIVLVLKTTVAKIMAGIGWGYSFWNKWKLAYIFTQGCNLPTNGLSSDCCYYVGKVFLPPTTNTPKKFQKRYWLENGESVYIDMGPIFSGVIVVEGWATPKSHVTHHFPVNIAINEAAFHHFKGHNWHYPGWWFFATPLKNMTSSVVIKLFPIYGKS